MKFFGLHLDDLCERSSPSRGTWIEIHLERIPQMLHAVVPLAGDVD